MTLYQAYVVLKHHADWRQGKREDMVKPQKLTEALNVILVHLSKKLMKESYAAI